MARRMRGLIAVRSCPIWSCSSCASDRRSSSWASTSRCDSEAGCDGYLIVDLVSPEPCELLAPDDPKCGIGGMDPASMLLGTVTVTSDLEGERELDYVLSTGDGTFFYDIAYSPFTASSGVEVEFLIEKAPGAPEILIDIRAEWAAVIDPGAAALVGSLIGGGTRVLISHDVEHGLAEADLVLGLRAGRVTFCERDVTPADVRALYA